MQNINNVQKQLDIWFKPWEYTHYSWIENSLFENLNIKSINKSYIPWCKYVGINYKYQHYQSIWLEQYWIPDHQLILAINLLGSMLHKQKDNISSVSQLRWAQQTALARPIIFTKNIKFSSNFEAGINLLYQILQCYCPQVWTRFLLQLPKEQIQIVNIHNEPLLNGKMILIIEKLWSLILKKIS